MYSIMKSRIDGMKNEVEDFLCQLLETASLSTGEERIADLVYRELGRLAYDKVYRDDIGNVIGVIRGVEGAPTVLLNSHLDTVLIDPEKWDSDPFKAVISGNRIYGAGAADCKGGLTAQVYAGELLKRCLLPFRGNLVLALTVAEENGCSVGVKTLLSETLPALGLKPDYAILGEPTNLGIYYGHDGRMELDIKVEGNDPFTVDDGVRNICRDLSGRDAVGKRQPADDIILSPPEFRPLGNRLRANIHLEKKLHPEERPETAADWLKHETELVVGTQKALAVEVMVTEDEQKLFCKKKTLVKHVSRTWQTDPFDPLMEKSRQALTAAGCEVKTGKWKLCHPGMGTAGSVFCNDFHIPVIGYGPGEEEQAHNIDESVDFGKVVECMYGSAAIVHSLVGIPVFGWTADEI